LTLRKAAASFPDVSKRALKQGGVYSHEVNAIADTNSTDGAHMFSLGLCIGWMTMGALVIWIHF
jgi:hypothetical protein